MLQPDSDLFLHLNAGADPSAAVVWLAIFAAKLVVLIIPLYIAALWITGRQQHRLTAMMLVLGLVIALTLSHVIGLIAFRPRPFMIGLGHALIDHRPNASFPSNHGLIFAVSAAVLFLRGYRAAWLVAALGILVAWSRIYLGVHYPLDMIGAAIIAVPVALASRLLIDRYGMAILTAQEQLSRRIMQR